MTVRLDPGMESTTHDIRRERVAVGVATYRRPDQLDRLLAQFPGAFDASDGPLHCLLVVDNDPDRSAADVIDFHRRRLGAEGLRLLESVEPRPGIGHARNRVLDLAEAEEIRWLAFLDDDETIVSGWPAGLLRVARSTGATAVGGPVLVDAVGAPEWMLRPHFLGRAPRPHGEPTDQLATNNVVLDLDALRALDLRFDPEFGVDGGSDALLTKQIVAAGGHLSWATDAIVSETFESWRVDEAWLRRRWRRNGILAWRLAERLGATASERSKLLSTALVRVIAGTAMSVLRFVPIERTQIIGREAVRQRHYGSGVVAGAVGIRMQSYGPSGSETRGAVDA